MGLKPKIIKPSDFINPLLSKKSVEQEKFEKFQTDLNLYEISLKSQHVSKQSKPNIVSNALKPFFESFGYTAQSFSQKGQSGVDLAIMREHKPSVAKENPHADTSELEAKIDELVYKLYSVTDEEIKIVEGEK